MLRHAIGGIAALLISQPLLAASWQVVPEASTEGIYDTNAGLATNDSDDGTFSVQVAGALDLRRETQRTSVSIVPRVEVARFLDDDQDDLDRESYFLNAVVDHTMERSAVGVRGRFSRQPTYRSELDLSLPDDPDNTLPSAGGDLTIREDEQTRFNIQPYWSYEVSQRDTLDVSLTYNDVSYEEDDIPTGRFDYDEIGAAADWSRALTPRTSVVVGVSASTTEAEDPATDRTNDIDSYTASLGYRWQSSETSTLQVNVGATSTDQESAGRNLCVDPADIAAGVFCEVESDDTNLSGDILWRVRGERNNLVVQLSRSVQPSSNGSAQTRDQLRVFLDRSFTRRLSGRFGVIGSEQESVTNQNPIDRTFIRAEAEARWRLAPQWTATAGYRFTSRESDGAAGATFEDFENNEFRVGISWQAARR